MIFYKKHSKQFMTVALTASIVFISYLLLPPLLYNENSEAAEKNRSVTSLNQRLLISQESNSFYLALAATENEYLIDAVSYHIMSRSQQVSRQLPNLLNYAFAVLLVGYGVLIFKSKNQLRDTNHHISVLAISLGGHAPPEICNP